MLITFFDKKGIIHKEFDPVGQKVSRFADVKEIYNHMMAILKTISHQEFSKAFQSLYERFQKCVVAGGDHFEGDLLFLKSRKGHPVVINNGHIYTLNHKQDTKTTWYCVKRHTLNCEGCLVTNSDPMLLSYSGHNHPQLNDIIQRLQAYSSSSSTSQDGNLSAN